MSEIESYLTPTHEPKQTCVFCNRQAADMPVFSIGVGRIGICLHCARKAVESLERYESKNGR